MPNEENLARTERNALSRPRDVGKRGLCEQPQVKKRPNNLAEGRHEERSRLSRRLLAGGKYRLKRFTFSRGAAVEARNKYTI